MIRILFALIASFTLYTAQAAKYPIPASPKLAAKSFLLMDHNTGTILAEKNADERLEPASLTKLMTSYVVFRELAAGHIQLSDEVTVSEKAWKTGGSRMFIEVGKKIPLELLLKGMIIQSGNDASVALAEYVAGDEATFAMMMNNEAQRLGMDNTHFTNSTGLPSKELYTTARDLTKLFGALIAEFPEYYRWYSERVFKFNNIEQFNRNKLLWKDDSVDGGKTGYTKAAGYCLVASAKREDMRLIAVVMGTDSAKSRIAQNQTLLNYGFRFFKTHRLYGAGETLQDARVWKGAVEKMPVGLAEDLHMTIPAKAYKDLDARMILNDPIEAPIEKGQSVGRVEVYLGDELRHTQDLIALIPVAEGGFFQQLMDSAKQWME